jgi:hypothetical protein
MKRMVVFAAACLLVTACNDSMAPTAGAPAYGLQPSAQQLFQRYVSLGTSITHGVQAAGVFDDAQKQAWSAQLAARVGASYTLPLVYDPGCPAPLLAPLAANLVLLGAFAAFGTGGDLVSTLGGICMPNRDGVVLPANNVGISGARAHDALYTTPEIAASISANRGAMYSRVLLPGQTQVAAMLAQQPTFVSIELATNEVLPASTGRLAAMPPYTEWVTDFDQVVAAVQSTGARAVIVGLPISAATFPSVRRAREFFQQWPYLLTLGITVSINCYFSPNHLFIPGYLLSLLKKAPTTATCADVPGAVDYVLTPSDITAINARMALMNAHMEARALENGYAFFKLSVLFDLPKVSFNMYDVLFSSKPFGPYMSLDGVHPNGAGHAIIASSAAQAINAKYGVAIP